MELDEEIFEAFEEALRDLIANYKRQGLTDEDIIGALRMEIESIQG